MVSRATDLLPQYGKSGYFRCQIISMKYTGNIFSRLEHNEEFLTCIAILILHENFLTKIFRRTTHKVQKCSVVERSTNTANQAGTRFLIVTEYICKIYIMQYLLAYLMYEA